MMFFKMSCSRSLNRLKRFYEVTNRFHISVSYQIYFLISSSIEILWTKLNYWRIPGKYKYFEEECVNGKVIVITGANSGLGKHTAKKMAERGAIVVMGCRNMTKGEIARDEIIKDSGSQTVELYQLDLSDFSSVRCFAAEVLQAHPVIDILINNAGSALNQSQPALTREGWHIIMKTNYLGHFLLTKLLINSINLSTISRVVSISSTLCIGSTLDTADIMMTKETNMGILGLGEMPYMNSKLALALFMKELAKKYPSVKVYSLCTGVVKTEIFSVYKKKGFMELLLNLILTVFGLEIEDGVDTILMCSLARNMRFAESGIFFRFGRRVGEIQKILNEEVSEKLWHASEKIIESYC